MTVTAVGRSSGRAEAVVGTGEDGRVRAEVLRERRAEVHLRGDGSGGAW
jgi:hypothetical protein